MDLELIIAPSGLGKTNYILDDIEKNRQKNKIIVITPDQNSYNFEKILCSRFGGTFNIDVVNFSRFYKKIENLIGVKSPLLDETSKYFYYLELIEKLQDKNNFLVDRMVQDFEFIKVIDEILNELNDYNLSEVDLEKYCQENSDKTNSDKIKAIKEIQEEYNKILVENSKFNKREYVREILLYMNHVNLSEYIFYIDGYYNFSPLEYEVIEKLILKSKKVGISIISNIDRYTNFKLESFIKESVEKDLKYNFISKGDVKENKKYSLDIYRKSHEIIAYLNNIISKNSLEKFNLVTFYSDSIYENYLVTLTVKKGEIDNHTKIKYPELRYKNETLYHIQKEFPKNTKSISEVSGAEFNVLKAENQELEVQQLCRNISKEINLFGYKASDIAILYRNEQYENFSHIFKNYSLNIHIDRDINVSNHRLIRLVKNVLNYSDVTFKESILDILKTNLSNFDKKFLELAKKEGDCSVKSISIEEVEQILEEKMVLSYTDLEKEYFIRENKEYNSATLTLVKIILQDMVEYIRKLKKKKTVGNYIKELANILDYFDIKMLLLAEDSSHDSIEELENISIDRQVYDKFLKILNEIEENFSSKKVGFESFSKVLTILLDKIKYRSIPQVDDYIIMSRMDLAKVENKEIVFVLGLNKDVLPRTNLNNSLLDDEDKYLLSEFGIDLSPTSKSLIIDEDFVAYIAFTRSRDKLFLSYSISDKDYKKIKPSMYVENLSKIIRLKNEKLEFPERLVDEILRLDINDLDRYDFDKNKDLIFYSKSEVLYIYNKIKYCLEKLELDQREKLEKLERKYSILIENLNFFVENKEFLDMKELVDEDITSIKQLVRHMENSKKINLDLSGLIPESYSFTQIKKYIDNPYIYFISKILSIKEEAKYGITPLNKGIFIHAIMEEKQLLSYIKEKTIKFICDDTFTSEEVIEEVVRYIEGLTNEIEVIIKEILRVSSNPGIVDFLSIIKNENINSYTMTSILNSLVQSVKVEIHYAIVSKYEVSSTEEDFLFEFSSNSISLLSKNKKVLKEIFLNREYSINKFLLSGKIDRIDFNGEKYIIIDYKSSQNDFKLDEFLGGVPSQLLIYMLFLYMKGNTRVDNISGVFFREIAKANNEINKYRLRGLMNLELLKEFDLINSIAYVRVKNAKDKLKREPYATDVAKVYTSQEFEKILIKNINNIYTQIEKIQSYQFNLESKELEIKSLFDYSALVDTSIKKEYTKIKAVDFKKDMEYFLGIDKLSIDLEK